ncbi:transcriptional regulator, GntR family with LacI sensor [Beutenbergia cavernae DSM 12333]|uniref:Transcriptional regulator, GntR family with LacI sensor n=1 Tax=Beutenbergia cavernae (strain ATCC BAA-8 / DSM 12333 / CCUG 43141 / JCM 11478 / NBRC 16432 / NCIMB 13614 / HKI 0122) TaxID=471853 RepID=C5C5U4_BEUC1|nr:LacI family DNA-binding transcriptional regulator [Beutenbergia cavernae]ACQ82302.1 transcriptional regulator, GntR family with LacI sensor [Beutenbergia cavernae DSM 12333]
MIRPQREDALLKELQLRGSLVVSDIAERLGVSVVTLRRDLASLEKRGLLHRVHGGATAVGRTDPGTRRPVRRGEIPTIGMVAPTTGNYYASIIRSANRAAQANGVRLVLGVTNYIARDERRSVAAMVAAGADGLLVTPSLADFSGPTLDLLLDSPIPVVLLERSLEEFVGPARLESVRSDHEFGAELCVHHLVDQGFDRIALLTAGNPTSPRLLAGYRKAITELGLLEHAPRRDLPEEAWVTEARRDEIRALLQELVDAGITGVIVQPDAHAMALLQEAAELGIRIPDDLAIVAYDDQFSELAEIPLTAVAPPAEALGRTAIALCLDRMRHPVSDPLTAMQQVRIMPSLNVRSSSVRRSDG